MRTLVARPRNTMTPGLLFSAVRSTTTWSEPGGDCQANVTPRASTAAVTPRTFAAHVTGARRRRSLPPTLSLLAESRRPWVAWRLGLNLCGATDCVLSPVTVAFGVSNRPSSSTGREGGSLRPRNPPDAAPAAKTSAESARVLFQRTIGDRRAGARAGLWTIGVRERSAGAWVRRSLGRSRGSGRNVRARSARTGSTSASSGLIAPRSASSLCDAPKGRNGASNESRTTSDPGLTGTLLQAPRSPRVLFGVARADSVPAPPPNQRARPTRNALFATDCAAPLSQHRGFVRPMR